ncbi:MAG: ABC transporter substrate-binding protein [Gammaproteobacteria bacterium]|nr:ABC transporter substrate-binding protein [Gammaproteobacteria bacterium]
MSALAADPIKVGILHSLSGIMAVMPSAPATPDAWAIARG